MKRAMIVAVALVAGCSAGSDVYAQERSVPGSVVQVSDVIPDDGLPIEQGIFEERPALPPRAILAMLDSSGFSILSPPIRRGPAYVVAVIDPNGTDGRVIVDALSGRIVRFRPIVGEGAMTIPDDVRAIYARQDLVPPRNIPNVRPRPARRLPAPRLAERAPPSSDTVVSAPRMTSPTSAPHERTVAAAPAARQIETSPPVQIQPTQPMPPVQGFE